MTLPIYLALVTDQSSEQRNRLALQACLVAFSVITLFALFDQSLTGKSSDPTASAGVNVSLVPLGIPLIAGLLLSAIAVQMIPDAVRAFIKAG
jgi:small neutral amino acid transporter SnatA (MarC family)